MDSEPLSMRRQQIGNATLKRMSGTPDPFWTLGKCIAIAVIAGFGVGVVAILWVVM